MSARVKKLVDWLDSRTGYRAGLSHLLDEPLPSGVGWWFTLGSVLLALLGVQGLTGLVLAMYYVPTPDHAYDSIRFLTSEVTFGRLLRGLHFFGASFIVIAAGLHLLRVLCFASYKRPREMTWVSGVALLLIILAFSLSGYLLPWDQRAYWATVVTINIAKSAPLVGQGIASLIQGGSQLGALTLSRWYSAHVLLLPAGLTTLVVAHIYLMRRHGISGPTRPRDGGSQPFYPYHAVKDAVAVAMVLAALFSIAAGVATPLELQADPTDQTYIPRPEWYFLGLFQLLKYFPGRLEPLAAIGVPTLLVALLLFLPLFDRGPERRLSARPAVAISTGLVVLGIVMLTMLGWRDSPASVDVNRWGPSAIAGRALASDERCARCHTRGGVGPDLATAYLTRDDQWILGHAADPEMIAPGLRPKPPGGFTTAQAQAVVAFVKKRRAGARLPVVPPQEQQASMIFALHCSRCHVVDGIGGDEGPDLSRVGQKRDQAWLVTEIADPSEIDVNATMPAFDEKLAKDDIQVLATYLAARRDR